MVEGHGGGECSAKCCLLRTTPAAPLHEKAPPAAYRWGFCVISLSSAKSVGALISPSLRGKKKLPAVIGGHSEGAWIGEALVAFDASISIIEEENPFGILFIEKIFGPEGHRPVIPLVT